MDPDRFQKDDEAWPGHWATPPRPWQKPERRLLSLETCEHLKDALAELPERQRLIVGLRDIDGHSAEEVCDLLGLTRRTSACCCTGDGRDSAASSRHTWMGHTCNERAAKETRRRAQPAFTRRR